MLINLIKNELSKMLNKKLNVCVVIMLLFIIGTNLIYKYKLDDIGNFKEEIDYRKEQEIYKNKIENCTFCTVEKINEYEYMIELNRIKEQYGYNSWQSYVFENILNFEDQSYLKKFKEDNWKSFVYDEIEKNKNNMKYIEMLNYRLNNNIKYGYDYINKAIDNYISSNSIEEEQINKYILDTKNDINKINDLRGILINFFNEYEILIIAMLLIICGGILIEEYSHGTIKQLLILPCSRRKILLSKYITTIIIFILLFLFIFLFQIIIGTMFFGLQSLKIPVVIYNGTLQVYSIYKYMLMILLGKIPMILLLPLMIIFLNNITKSTTFVVLFSFVLYISSKILIVYSNMESMKFLKIFMNIHWDISSNIINKIYDKNLNISICICVLYLIILSIICFKKFSKTDIKNSL